MKKLFLVLFFLTSLLFSNDSDFFAIFENYGTNNIVKETDKKANTTKSSKSSAIITNTVETGLEIIDMDNTNHNIFYINYNGNKFDLIQNWFLMAQSPMYDLKAVIVNLIVDSIGSVEKNKKFVAEPLNDNIQFYNKYSSKPLTSNLVHERILAINDLSKLINTNDINFSDPFDYMNVFEEAIKNYKMNRDPIFENLDKYVKLVLETMKHKNSLYYRKIKEHKYGMLYGKVPGEILSEEEKERNKKRMSKLGKKTDERIYDALSDSDNCDKYTITDIVRIKSILDNHLFKKLFENKIITLYGTVLRRVDSEGYTEIGIDYKNCIKIKPIFIEPRDADRFVKEKTYVIGKVSFISGYAGLFYMSPSELYDVGDLRKDTESFENEDVVYTRFNKMKEDLLNTSQKKPVQKNQNRNSNYRTHNF